jgi:hypothetical protein
MPVARLIKQSTFGGCQLLGCSLVSWSSKKQNFVSLSTTEAEYISAGSCCAQVLWMKQTLLDYGVKFKEITLLCDNESVIKIANNSVQHLEPSILIFDKGDIKIDRVSTDDQSDIFTKPLNESRFCKLRNELNVIDFLNVARELAHVFPHMFIFVLSLLIISCLPYVFVL